MRTRTEPATRSEPAIRTSSPHVRLAISLGAQEASCEKSQPVMLIGGRRDCDLPIAHAEVSQVHCAILNNGHALTIVDLASRAGTFVNDRRVTSCSLKAGDRVRVGSIPIAMTIRGLAARPRGLSAFEPKSQARPFAFRNRGEAYTLSTLPAIIGRRKSCSLVIDTPDVSLAHAILMLIDDCPAIFDLGSRSGTFVNGQKAHLEWLASGDEVSVGGEKLQVVWEGAAPPHAVAALTASAAIQPQAVPAAPPPPPAIAAAPDETSAESVAAATPVGEETARPTAADMARFNQWFSRVEQHVDQLRTQMLGHWNELVARETQLDTGKELLAADRCELESREADMTRRAGELDEQARQLAGREAALADTAERIERFKAALSDAGRRLTSTGGPADFALPPASYAGTAPKSAQAPALFVGRPLFANTAPSQSQPLGRPASS